MESAPASSTTKHWYFRRFVGYNVHVSIGLANLPMRTKFTAHALAWTHAWVPQISFKIGAGRRKFKIDESPLTWTLQEAKNLTMNVHVTSSWILFKTCLSVHVSGTVTCVTLTRCKWCFLVPEAKVEPTWMLKPPKLTKVTGPTNIVRAYIFSILYVHVTELESKSPALKCASPATRTAHVYMPSLDQRLCLWRSTSNGWFMLVCFATSDVSAQLSCCVGDRMLIKISCFHIYIYTCARQHCKFDAWVTNVRPDKWIARDVRYR